MSMNVGYAVSSYSSRSLDEIADAAGECLRFFQLYIFARRDLVLDLVRRAEGLEYKALVLTVDVPILGNRATFNRAVYPNNIYNTVKSGILTDLNNYQHDPSVTWEHVKLLKSQTKLPLILKGILNAEDAVLAVEAGASGIIVSTHGGRQLDTIPASIDALADVAKAVNGQCEVYMDGGIRRGTDILKALALGARVVFVGRPAIYALAYNGEDGVRQMLQILKEEFHNAMALSGCACIDDIRSVPIVRKRFLDSRL